MEPMMRSEGPKLAEMVMCGDHPSVTKTELNVKELNADKEKPKERAPMSYARISPTTSRSGRERATSEHALRPSEARCGRSLAARRTDVELASAPNRALLQAALGSFRWPPYLVLVWAAVLLITHALHGLVGLLERTLPPLKKFCQYFRAWTEDCWKGQGDLGRVSRAALACFTAALCCVYCVLWLVYSAALWAVEPLCAEPDDKPVAEEARVTDYVDLNTRPSSHVKN